MDKKESLAFLQSCIDSVNVATCEEIELFQKIYELNCTKLITSSNFEFIPPVDVVNCAYETSGTIKMTISETECIVHKIKCNYNFVGIRGSNEQSDNNLPYAA